MGYQLNNEPSRQRLSRVVFWIRGRLGKIFRSDQTLKQKSRGHEPSQAKNDKKEVDLERSLRPY